MGKVGELRVIMYLEDLGPVELLMQKEDVIEKQIVEEDKKMATKEKNYFNNTGTENYAPGFGGAQNPGFT